MIGSVGNSLRVPYTASSTLRDTGSVGTDGSTAPGSGYQVGSDGKARDERGLTAEDQKQIQSLKKRDTEVRTHENAHKSVGGPYAGSPTYSFQAGPDGQRYAIGGEVSIDAGPEKEPAATIRKMETVKRAALAPAEPSPQDYKVAAQADQAKLEAQQELGKQKAGKAGYAPQDGTSNVSDASADGENSAQSRSGGQQQQPDTSDQSGQPAMVPFLVGAANRAYQGAFGLGAASTGPGGVARSSLVT
jgi:hypothetical protein